MYFSGVSITTNHIFLTFALLFSTISFGQTSICVTAVLATEIWASEISWGIVNSDGIEVYASSEEYTDWSAYTEEICLEPDCYTVWMNDSYGDGWQGGELRFYSAEGEIIATGYVPAVPGDYFEINLPLQDGCPINGCTHVEAINFDPEASVDDGSCVRGRDNSELLSHWTDSTLPINGFNGSFSDVEGLEVNGREFGIIASTIGAHIIDITADDSPVEVAFLPGADGGTYVTHRDYHIDGTLLFAVCDQAQSSLQIFDLSGLPDSVETVYDDNEFCITAHNVFVDNDSDLLYLCSTYNYSGSAEVKILDVSDPYNPSELTDLNPWISVCHDIYVENDTAWINSGNQGLFVMHIDETPTMLGNLDEYFESGYNHSGWWIPEDDIYVFADETHGSDLKIVDTSNLNDLQVLATFNSGTEDNAVPHNVMIKEGLLYVSYYHDGLQIFDITTPNEPILVAWYDTFVQSSYSGYQGACGIHSFLPSGKVLISDITNGLFVINPTPEIVDVCPWEDLDIVTYEVVADDFWGTDIVWQIPNYTYNACADCIGDLDGNGSLGVSDMHIILLEYGCTEDCPVDFNGDGITNIDDLLFWLPLFGTVC